MTTHHLPNISPAQFDVLGVGGGPAGLSAALMLGRSRRSVLVVDAMAPRKAPAAGVHGFLTRDGTPPADLLELARAEVARYDVRHQTGQVVAATRDVDGFVVDLADAAAVHARRLVVTTGVVDADLVAEELADPRVAA